ncbi:transmembrane protein, putative [Medicago truncatula]|uniref:Transmembrane protein, putative n=1 Tax=Medicago truncatula TaxID=3880 RepID=G7LET1_MEDTR|nr:transmembrane protein, putative [Medicago truncatula]
MSTPVANKSLHLEVEHCRLHKGVGYNILVTRDICVWALGVSLIPLLPSILLEICFSDIGNFTITQVKYLNASSGC